MNLKNQILNQLSLFTSFSTLICCALPSLLVILGFGAVFSSLIGLFPQIIWLSEHKIIVFSVSGLMILINWIVFLKTKKIQACEIQENSNQPTACEESKSLSNWILYISTILWMTGAFFAFLIKYFI
jgi:mercuric ion transport protein